MWGAERHPMSLSSWSWRSHHCDRNLCGNQNRVVNNITHTTAGTYGTEKCPHAEEKLPLAPMITPLVFQGEQSHKFQHLSHFAHKPPHRNPKKHRRSGNISYPVPSRLENWWSLQMIFTQGSSKINNSK